MWSLLFIAAFVSYFVWRWPGGSASWSPGSWLSFFAFFARITTVNMLSGVFWGDLQELPGPRGASGRLVPIYEENERAGARGGLVADPPDPPAGPHLRHGRRVSEIPLVGFEHPKVTWMRQENQGKRHAQAT